MTYGGIEFTKKRAEVARARFAGPADVIRFGVGLVLIVLGGLLMTEGIVGAVNETTLFFEGVNRGFEFVVGFVTIVVGASLIPAIKQPVPA